MSNYDFSTLSALDFEKLACDLLNEYHSDIEKDRNGTFRTFKEGKDQGIDLLFSTEEDYKIVAQVKHYVKTTFSSLKRDLEHKEKKKVIALNPDAYIFMTSQPLSPANKVDIKKIFEPYILSLEDIFGQDDLNQLIRKYPSVEEKHFKLWFSSIITLKKILNYKYEGRTNEFNEDVLKRKLRLFVITKGFHAARRALKYSKFLIITGEPGVGKTTLSEMLIYDYIKNDYKLTVIYDNIKEVEDVINDDKTKQIFYFDDFLGHTQAEISKSKSAEVSMIKIINRIEKSENKLLILNTRKFILTTFIEESERLKNFNPLRGESKIELQSYSYGVRRRMLENHLSDTELNESQIEVVKNLTRFICNHNNFTPRLVEFFTLKKYVGIFKPQELENFILNNLKNPKKIWEHAYLEQISDYDRLLLNTLYSLGGETDFDTIEKAYHTRLEFEVKNNNFKKPLGSVQLILKKLNDGFLEINPSRVYSINFINPSLEDFLRYYIGENRNEVERILLSAISIEQWFYFYKPFLSKNHLPPNLYYHFIQETATYIGNYNIHESKYLSVIFTYYYGKQNEILDEVLIVTMLSEITNWSFLEDKDSIHIYNRKFLYDVLSSEKIKNYITNLDVSFFCYTFNSIDLLDELLDLVKLFRNHFDFDVQTAKNIPEDFYDYLLDKIYALFQDEIESQQIYLNTSLETGESVNILAKLDEDFELIREVLFPDFNVDFTFLKLVDWDEVTQTNVLNETYFSMRGVEVEIEEYGEYEEEMEEDYDDEEDGGFDHSFPLGF